MQKSKAETFIGFAVRANKITTGFNSIECLNRNVYLLIMCSSLTENGVKAAVKIKNKLACPMIICSNVKLEDVIHKENVKLAAIRDKQLAEAILANLDDNFKTYLGGSL